MTTPAARRAGRSSTVAKTVLPRRSVQDYASFQSGQGGIDRRQIFSAALDRLVGADFFRASRLRGLGFGRARNG